MGREDAVVSRDRGTTASVGIFAVHTLRAGIFAESQLSPHIAFIFTDRSPMHDKGCIYGFKAFLLVTFEIHNPNSMYKRTRSMRAHIRPWELALPRGCKIILVTGNVDYWITVEEPSVSPSSLETGVGGTQFSYKLLGRDLQLFWGRLQFVYGRFSSPRGSC